MIESKTNRKFTVTVFTLGFFFFTLAKPFISFELYITSIIVISSVTCTP